jgi:hypothetical protein
LYLHQIDRTKPERYLLQEAEKYHQYVIRLARYAVDQVAQLPEFQAIDKEAEFAVRVGEYMDISEIVYRESRQIKDLAAMKPRLEAIDEGLTSIYGVLTGLNLTRGDYWGIGLGYADLSGSDLSHSQMQYSTLTGAKFKQGSLAEANLHGAWLYEADFGQCNLRGANLTNVKGEAGLTHAEEWYTPGFRAVNFHGANLEDVDFKDAKLRGAVFVDANLKNVNFEGADLEKTVFTREDSENLNLNEAQRQRIIWR